MAETQPTTTQAFPLFRDRVVLISVLLLTASVFFFFIAPFVPVYWFRLAYSRIGIAFIKGWESGFSGLALVIVGGVWFLLIRTLVVKAKGFNARVVIVVLTVLTIFISILGSVIDVFLIAGHRSLSSDVLMNNRYYLEGWGGFDGTSYSLYRCNQLGFDCKYIDGIPGEFFVGDSRFIADPETNTLSVMIDNATIYTYTPP